MKKLNFMKKIGIVGSIQIILIIFMMVLLPVFIRLQGNLSILAIIISITSILITLLNEVNKAIEANKKSYVLRFHASVYNTDLGKMLEEEVNKLRQQNKIIDSIKIIDDKNQGNSSEVIIIYH